MFKCISLLLFSIYFFIDLNHPFKKKILRDHEIYKIIKITEVSLKVKINCEHFDFSNKLCHFTITVLIDSKFIVCHVSSMERALDLTAKGPGFNPQRPGNI